MTAEINDFDAAKAISEILNRIEIDRQKRVLRWVAEGLGINLNLQPWEDQSLRSKVHGEEGGYKLPETTVPRPRDIRSFVEQKSPKSDVQFAAVVAYYYRFEAPEQERRETISSQDLQNAARLANWKRFSKPTDTLNNAKKQGYLDAVDPGAYRISSVGENLVAMTLPGVGNGAKSTSKSKSKSKPKPKSKHKQKAKNKIRKRVR